MIPQLVQIDIEVPDLAIAAKFYADYLDLHPSPAEIFERVVLTVSDNSPFGISLIKGETKTQGINLYFQVDDLEAYLARARTNGVKTSEKAKMMAPYGLFGWIEDPFGYRIHLFSPKN